MGMAMRLLSFEPLWVSIWHDLAPLLRPSSEMTAVVLQLGDVTTASRTRTMQT